MDKQSMGQLCPDDVHPFNSLERRSGLGLPYVASSPVPYINSQYKSVGRRKYSLFREESQVRFEECQCNNVRNGIDLTIQCLRGGKQQFAVGEVTNGEKKCLDAPMADVIGTGRCAKRILLLLKIAEHFPAIWC